MKRYYDAINDRYLIPDATGTDPKTVWCIVLTRNWNDYSLSFDYEMSDRLLFRRTDLDFYDSIMYPVVIKNIREGKK